ncbi:MAG: hypothetical protein IKJ58_07475 [Akkermansia sp.]|nr:hypothetical protein [Akkermansia sp.]
MTKFRGLDRSGREVTLEVRTSSILVKQEVAEATAPAAPAPAAPETPSTPEPETTQTEAPAAEPQTTEGETSSAEAAPSEATPATPEAPQVAVAEDSSRRLREKLDQVKAEYQALSSPSSSLTSIYNSRLRTLERNMTELHRLATQVSELQAKYNTVVGGDYTFTIVPNADRDKYQRDGRAAYDAMVIDVREYRNQRKVGGLDKFEILRDRYQGIPEYREAYNWYMTTLRDLERRWGNLLRREEQRRARYNNGRREEMRHQDEAALRRLAAQFEQQGEQLAQVWFNPDARNLLMLRTASNKVRDAIRRNENGLRDEAIGTVPQLINNFWTVMDQARDLMIRGDFEGAKKLLDEDENFKKLVRLNTELFPNDYRTPLRNQRQALEREIQKRKRDRNNLQNQLQNAISRLERSSSAAEAQMDNLLEQIRKEREHDTETSTAEIEESSPQPASGNEG